MTRIVSWVKRTWSNKSLFGKDAHYSYSRCMQLVERSRCGDQVATAIISRVRRQAEAGNKVARESLEEIKRYAKANKPYTPAGEEAAALQVVLPEKDMNKIGPALSRVALANPNSAIVAIANSCNAMELAKQLNGELESDGFVLAFKKPAEFLKVMRKLNHEEQHPALLGYVLGLACRLQAVRNPKTPVGVFSQIAAWELGE